MIEAKSAREARTSAVAPPAARRLLLVCFFVSGFTALLYQTVWMRLALARFGVNSSVVATVLSVFMLGLALGSFLAGRWVERVETRFGVSALRVYGGAELLIGIGGACMPFLLSAGRALLLATGPANSVLYTVSSAVLLAATLLPFCTAMGLTFPVAVAFLRRTGASAGGQNPFSALYLANVAGALVGAVLTPLCLIEWLGFFATSLVAATGNVLIAAFAFRAFRRAALPVARLETPRPAVRRDPDARARRLALFVTGFTTMGMEVLWSRIYPTVLETFVYSFAAILGIYLFATTAGSFAYRRTRHLPAASRLGAWWPWLAATSLLPLLSVSVTLAALPVWLRVFGGLAPFGALLGFLTPAIVDREAGDDPNLVGRAYAVNLLGCLLGPLVAGFVLLPSVGARGTAVLLAVPLFAMLLLPAIRRDGNLLSALGAVGAAALIWFSTTLFEEQFPRLQVRHDHVATVVAAGSGRHKSLYVDGVGMTEFTTTTKMMAHLPLAHLSRRGGAPPDGLVICFGMGTTFRSLASWGGNVTAVELVPSVPEMFGYFFEDGPALLRETGRELRVETDDGRRFLDRSPKMFDVITVDPPPPVEAAGSSLLYSKEFYVSAKRRMKRGAILQMWLPGGDRETIAGAALSIVESFPHVRVFMSVQGLGFHFLASETPIPSLTARELVVRMPQAAVRDMREWVDAPPERFFEISLSNEYAPQALLLERRREATVAITDDRPVNEFFFLRRRFGVPSER